MVYWPSDEVEFHSNDLPGTAHILNSSADMLTTLRLAVFSEMLIVILMGFVVQWVDENAVMWHCMLVVIKLCGWVSVV